MTGVVSAFDEPRGLGTVHTDDGRTFAFHCTAIADGTRTIEVGAAVHFTLTPRLGEYEAAAIVREARTP